MRFPILFVSALVVTSALAIPAAFASIKGIQNNPGNNKVKIEDLEFFDKGVKLVVKGEVECLDDDEDVKIIVEAEGLGKASCENPGGKLPPGQNPVSLGSVDVEGHKSFDDDEQDGEVHFKITAKPDDLDLGDAPDCPSEKWEEELEDIRFTEARITVKQDGDTVLRLHCKFDEPTSNGKVHDFDCMCV